MYEIIKNQCAMESKTIFFLATAVAPLPEFHVRMLFSLPAVFVCARTSDIHLGQKLRKIKIMWSKNSAKKIIRNSFVSEKNAV